MGEGVGGLAPEPIDHDHTHAGRGLEITSVARFEERSVIEGGGRAGEEPGDHLAAELVCADGHQRGRDQGNARARARADLRHASA